MSLFGSVIPSVPVENLSVTKNNQVRCSQHQEEPSKLYFKSGLFGNHSPFAACSKCTKPSELDTICPASFQADSAKQCYTISPTLSKYSLSVETAKIDPPIEAQNHVFEHLLWDTQSKGYGLRSLAYMSDQGILVACAKNGSVCFWSIGDTIELKERLNLEKTINFVKYRVVSDKKKYLALGTENGVHIYNMAKKVPQLLGVIDEGKIVKDLDFILEESKLLTVYSEGMLKIWNLDSLKLEGTIDLHKYFIKKEIYTMIYLKKTHELAIESKKGLSVIDWQSKAKVRHHIVPGKNTFGCIHLPQSKRFILNNGALNIQILKEDLSEESRHEATKSLSGSPPSFPMKFVSAKDESQIISNGLWTRFSIYNGKSFQTPFVSSFLRELADVELMEDQYRIAIADQDQGTIVIYRINSNMKIQRSQGWPRDYSMPSINSDPLESAEKIQIPLSSVQPLSINSLNTPLLQNKPQTPVNLDRKNLKAAIAASSPKQVTKVSTQGKKIKKVQISVKKTPTVKKDTKKGAAMKKETKKKTSMKKDAKKKSKVPVVVEVSETLKKNQEKTQEEDSPVKIARIRTKKGRKSKEKEEKVWVMFSSESETDEEKKISKEKRGRSTEKKDSPKKNEKKTGKRKVDESEERSRSRSNSKSVTRKTSKK